MGERERAAFGVAFTSGLWRRRTPALIANQLDGVSIAGISPMEMPTGIAPAASPEQPRLARDEVPSLVAPGPWIACAALAFGLAFDALHAFRVLIQVPTWIRSVAALLLIALGCWHIFRAVAAFRRSGTPFQPWRPTRIIAAQDIYARTRNPTVQGFLVGVLGVAVLLGSDGSVLMLMPAAMLMHYGVVLREESYLERRFGDAYRQYTAAVPRYGWPFGLFG
jgi:protein-S-isoprenylcysteine O-methyltransferase Ste14